jgi:hypothetical protein
LEGLSDEDVFEYNHEAKLWSPRPKKRKTSRKTDEPEDDVPETQITIIESTEQINDNVIHVTECIVTIVE